MDDQPDMTREQIQEWILACNHAPARRLLHRFLEMQELIEANTVKYTHSLGYCREECIMPKLTAALSIGTHDDDASTGE